MMTTFQIILAAAGVLLIVAVLIYNIIQERRFRKQADQMFNYKQEDILLGESVHAPGGGRNDSSRIQLEDGDNLQPDFMTLDDLDIPGLDAPLDKTESPAPAKEPAKAPAPSPRTSAPAPASASEPPRPPTSSHRPPPPPDIQPDHPSPLDPNTEYIARLRLAAGGGNLAPLLSSLRRIGKPLRAYGYKPEGDWELLAAAAGRGPYALVEIGLQLADRGGAVTGEQIDGFCRALYGYTAEEGGSVTCPDKEAPLRIARELDLFCLDVDVLIGLNVVSGDARPFMGESIHHIVREAGLTLENGAYHARDAAGNGLFKITTQDEDPIPAEGRGITPHGLTLLFDVPRVPDGLTVFDRMTRLGYDLASRLDGRLVDDNGRQVNDDSLQRDRARLQDYFDRMARRGIPAGSERALRLFV